MIELQQLSQEFQQRREEFASLKEKVKQICRICLEISEEHQSQLARIWASLISNFQIIPEREISFEDVMEEVNRVNEVKSRVTNWNQAREIIRNTPLSENEPNFVLTKVSPWENIDESDDEGYAPTKGTPVIEEVD